MHIETIIILAVLLVSTTLVTILNLSTKKKDKYKASEQCSCHNHQK